jgi:hypothetical protein
MAVLYMSVNTHFVNEVYNKEEKKFQIDFIRSNITRNTSFETLI